MIPYIYVFIRTDIPIADQMVQVGHACQQSGALFGCPENCHLVLLQVPDVWQLLSVENLCDTQKIKYTTFFEIDSVEEGGQSMGKTAVCTEPIEELTTRNHFMKFELWS